MENWIEALRIVAVVLGIGLVIFVHESGHFIAARLCKVRVEVFSLGFGPRLFARKWGDTLYQIAAVPLGGFVKMSGDESWLEDTDPPSDSLRAKSVGQRFFIYSGGVLANVMFGLVVFPILFNFGVRFNEPMLGAPTPGGPAWHAGLEEGTRVLSINGNSVYSFMHIPNEVALGPADDCELELLAPGSMQPETVHVTPNYSDTDGIYTIGVPPAYDPENRIKVLEGTPAFEAGVRSGDRLIAVHNEVPANTLWRRFGYATRDGEPFRATFERDGETYEVEINPRRATEAAYSRIGVSAPINRVDDVRENPRTVPVDIRAEDRIQEVDGKPIYNRFDLLQALIAADGPARTVILRDGSERVFELDFAGPDEVIAFVSDLAIGLDSDSTVLSVTDDEPAALAGLRSGDEVVRIDGAEVGNYDDITQRSRAAAKSGSSMTYAVTRTDPETGTRRMLEVEVAPAPWHPMEYGFGPQIASYVFLADNPWHAMKVGFSSCWKFLQDTWLTLKGIVASRVSPKNLGGPIAIGVYAHSWASAGVAKFFFFLCILSINLAFINVLPIPLLDGGHLFFLIIEKIKGSPVSERVMSYSQLVGLVLIVSLFVFVIYNDVQRHIFS